MHRFRRILMALAVVIVTAFCGIVLWLMVTPPALLQVGAGYAAKIVCSNVFIAGRDPDEVLALDVQAPGHPLLRLMSIDVDHAGQSVRAAILGFIAENEAVYREGLGCAVIPPGISPEQFPPPPVPVPAVPVETDAGLWPDGQQIESDQAIMRILSDADLTGPGMRAVVVVKGGRIVGEAYGPGFSRETPLLGWSMTKTVNAAIVGTLMQRRLIKLSDRQLLPEWLGDERAQISLGNLLAMEDGLAFNENYGAVTDVTRMLFLEPDMAAYASQVPLEERPGTRFSYSSGTAILLSRIWMDRLPDANAATTYPSNALFRPLGMSSAVFETDLSGTFVGSSYLYASARDWARFSLFLMRGGVWNNKRLLPRELIDLMSQPNETSGGRFSKGQTWLAGRDEAGLPADSYFLEGHDGQMIAILPSLDLVVVRLGLTPRSLGYDTLPLVEEIVRQER